MAALANGTLGLEVGQEVPLKKRASWARGRAGPAPQKDRAGPWSEREDHRWPSIGASRSSSAPTSRPHSSGSTRKPPSRRSTGRHPHVVAMNYFTRDGVFYMTSYGKAQKVINIRRNPKVALMVEAGDEYAELRGVMIRGRCEILEGETAVRAAFEGRAVAQTNPAPVNPGAAASAPKRVVLKIVPEKIVSWDHRKLGGRY